MAERIDTASPDERARREQVIRDMYPQYSRAAILAKLPGYTWPGVRCLAHRLGVPRLVGTWDLPIDEQIEGEA